MKTLVLLMIVLAFCTNCTEGSPTSKSGGVNQSSAKEIPSPAKTKIAREQNNKNRTPSGESGALRVYIDPDTSEFTAPPEGEVVAARKLESPAAFGTSPQGLEEKPSPVPGGGTMVDLQGRFRSPLRATINSKGETKIGHQAIDNKD